MLVFPNEKQTIKLEISRFLTRLSDNEWEAKSNLIKMLRTLINFIVNSYQFKENNCISS